MPLALNPHACWARAGALVLDFVQEYLHDISSVHSLATPTHVLHIARRQASKQQQWQRQWLQHPLQVQFFLRMS